ncbi:MAG: hypothetical protein M5T61_18230 [Acidimicrobiia bacterium]|nr:hypothetical protein [Acidimicrobiia bacterium]
MSKASLVEALRAVGRFFFWCQEQGLEDLDYVEPLHVAAYVGLLDQTSKKRTVSTHRLFPTGRSVLGF